MILLQCKKCSHFIELEGVVPKRLRCPGCGSTLDAASDTVKPQAETIDVESGPFTDKTRRGSTPKGKTGKAADRPVFKSSDTTLLLGKSRRGDAFGNYTILDEVARGAMGIIYRARQTNLNRVVALKLLIAGEHASQDQIERFYRETHAVAKLRHPNIIPIHDMGKVDNQHYFAMEYVEGKSLEDIILKGDVTEEATLDITAQVGRALSHAHEQGIVHRDVKPGNILVDKNGHVKVTDFGLARDVKKDRNMTHSGVTVGTPHYMSPEQARGSSRRVDKRSDIYSLGAVLYELLTGRPPFDGETPVEIVLKVIQREPVAPRKLRPRISRELETICMKALDKDPDRRYQTMTEFLADIDRYKAGEPIEARPSTFVYSIRKKVNKHKELSMAVSAALIVLSIIFIALEYRYVRADRAVTDLRQKLRQTTKRESELREKQEREATYQEKWKKVFGEPFNESTMAQWIPSGGTWKPLDSYLIGRATEPASLDFRELLCGSVRVGFYFMLDAPLTGHFGFAVSSAADAAQSGYRFLFVPGKLVLFKGDTQKKEVEIRLDTNCQYELLLVRENDLLRLFLDDNEILSYRDLMPLTGKNCSHLRFLLSGSQVSIAELTVERESTPLRGSPLIMADRLFMEGLYQPAIEVYRRVAEMPPDAHMAAEALYKMGLAYAKIDSLTEAVECFRQVTALYENSKHTDVAWLQLGLAYLKLHDYTSLRGCLEKHGLDPFMREVLREAPPEVIEAYVNQIELPGEKTDPRAKVKGLREFILLSSFLPEGRRDRKKLAGAHVLLGTALYDKQQYPESIKACRDVIASYSDQFDQALQARFLLGQTHMAMDDFAAAAANFEEWLKLYPLKSFSRRVVRDVMRTRGRVARVMISDRGWSYLRNYVEKLNQVQRSLAAAYVELGRLSDAVVLVDTVIEELLMGAQGKTVESYLLARIDQSGRQKHWAAFWKGCMQTMQGTYHKALASFNQAYRPPMANGRILKLPEGASEEQKRALVRQIELAFGVDEEAADDNTRVNIMRFVLHLKLGNRTEAFKQLGVALADNPDFFGPPTQGLSAIFTLEVLPDEIPAAVPKNEEAYCYLAGVALFAATRKDDARAFLTRAAGKKAWWPYHLARIELAVLDAGGSF